MASNNDKVEMEGVVINSLPSAFFKVKVEDDSEVIAKLSGKMLKSKIRVIMGDKVKVELSPYDTKRGRIVFRDR